MGVQLGELSALSIIEQNYTAKKNANSRALLAASLIKLGELDRAEKLANQWIESNEDLAMGYQTLANAAIEKGDQVLLEKSMQKLLKIEPNNRFANVYFAQKFSKTGNFEKALELYSSLLALYPKDLNILASAYNHLKPLDKAQSIVEAVDSDKRTDDIILVPFYTSVLLREQRYQDVVTIVEKFVSEHNLSDSAWNNYIFALRAQGNLQASLAANKQWVKSKSDSIAALMSLVVSYELTNEPQNALSTITNIESKFGQTFDTQLTRIYFLILNRQLELAQREFDSLTNTEGLVQTGFYKGVRGRLAYFSQDYASAEIDLREAYSQTQNEKTLKFLVSTMQANNKILDATKVLKGYTESRPSDLLSLMQLAELAAGFDDETEEWAYKQILKMSPDNLFASNNYAMLLLSQNRLKLAKSIIDKILFKNQLHPQLIDTAARVSYASGDTESGNNLFKFLIEKTDGEYATYLYLKYLTDTKQYALARTVDSESGFMFSSYEQEINELRSIW